MINIQEIIEKSAHEQLEKLKLVSPTSTTKVEYKITYNGTPLLIKGRSKWDSIKSCKLALRHAVYTWDLREYRNATANDYTVLWKGTQEIYPYKRKREIEELLVQKALSLVKIEKV